ncbi:MAG: hypothetical protein RR548_06070, partial [Carnobacterium sp.]|uniref:hypothetical protein n=1 Tax=Carnobacterium sp. TaxID=48221 RepID=UPI002FC7B570
LHSSFLLNCSNIISIMDAVAAFHMLEEATIMCLFSILTGSVIQSNALSLYSRRSSIKQITF